jgi:hypothetical protein
MIDLPLKNEENCMCAYLSGNWSDWAEFVLAKNVPKGEIVGYLYVGFIIA